MAVSSANVLTCSSLLYAPHFLKGDNDRLHKLELIPHRVFEAIRSERLHPVPIRFHPRILKAPIVQEDPHLLQQVLLDQSFRFRPITDLAQRPVLWKVKPGTARTRSLA